ncbi:MAG: alpha/beta hydrolase [Treponema sp.]|nr:alpha/beta hydrolase [Treponema sp.]
MNTKHSIRRFAGILLGMTLAVSAFAADAAEGQRILDTYTAPEQLGQPRLAAIRPFTGTVTEESLSEEVQNELKKAHNKPAKLTVKALNIDGIHVLDIYTDDGKEKPLLIFLDGMGSKRGNFFYFWVNGNLKACEYARAGIRIISMDAAALGDSDAGPLPVQGMYAETVHYIDRIIEYYNTVDGADASRFAIEGHSFGAGVAFAYGAHGSYKPRAILAKSGVLSLSDTGDKQYDCSDHGEPAENFMTDEQIEIFSERYSPIQWPEKFKDVYVYAANGLQDDTQSADSVMALEAKLKEMGSKNYKFIFDKKSDHNSIGRLFDQNILAVLKKQLLKK